MIPSKNHKGFTLIETLLALAIFALTVTPLYVLQGTVLRGAVYFSQRLQRIWLAKNFFLDARDAAQEQDAKQFTLEKKIDEPVTRLKYSLDPLDAKSSFKGFPSIYIERVTAEWDQGRSKQEEVLVSFILKPQVKKKS